MDLPGTALPDTATHRNRRKIRSQTSAREYTVSQRITTGAWECSCPGWTTHRKCKHLPKDQAREHWMCVACQHDHLGAVALSPCSKAAGPAGMGDCCWCGKISTQRIAPPGMALPCHDVHLDDVS